MGMNDYKTWLSLSCEQRQEQILSWDVYAREGLGFVISAAGELVLKSEFPILDVGAGTYHGGQWVIHAYVSKAVYPECPQSFEREFAGFPIVWIELNG